MACVLSEDTRGLEPRAVLLSRPQVGNNSVSCVHTLLRWSNVLWIINILFLSTRLSYTLTSLTHYVGNKSDDSVQGQKHSTVWNGIDFGNATEVSRQTRYLEDCPCTCIFAAIWQSLPNRWKQSITDVKIASYVWPHPDSSGTHYDCV